MGRGVFFWETMVIIHGAPWFFVLWGVPFVLMGLYLIGGRFWVDAKQRERTFYGLTDHRVMMVSGLFQPQVRTLDLRFLGDLSLRERPDRSGSIVFGPSAWLGPIDWFGDSRWNRPAFVMIDNVRDVYDTIRREQSKRAV